MDDQLAGSGHRLTLTLQGDLPRPEPAREASVTELEIAPAGTSRLGDEVTLTAQVARGPEVSDEIADEPTGFVVFVDKGRTLATREVIDGTATFTTTELPTGNYDITAEYRGDGIYGRSSSAPVEHRILTDLYLSWNLPSTIPVGGDPAVVDLIIDRTPFSLGGQVRPEITITRSDTGSDGSRRLDQGRIVIEWWDGTTWQPTPLTITGSVGSQVVTGPIGPTEGEPFTEGASATRRFRITPGPDGAPELLPGRFAITATLVPLTEGTPGAVIGTLPGATTVTPATRWDSRIRLNASVATGAGVSPHTVRPGASVRVSPIVVGQAISTGNGVATNLLQASGHLTVTVGGQPVNIRMGSGPIADGFVPVVPLREAFMSVEFVVPEGLPPGRHPLVIRYSGDEVFAPAVWDAATVATYPRSFVAGLFWLAKSPPTWDDVSC